MTDVELRLQQALLRAELLERGIHPIAVRGLLADDTVMKRLKNGGAAMNVVDFAAEIIRDVPHSMLRDAESPEDWAARRFGDKMEKYLARYRPPSKLRG